MIQLNVSLNLLKAHKLVFVCWLILSGCYSIRETLAREYDVPTRHFRCESKEKKLKYCDVDAIGGVRLVKQLSNTPCIKGRTWGYNRFGVWVDYGCRAEFISGTGDDGEEPMGHKYRVIRCESQDNKRQYCPTEMVDAAAELIRQISHANCVQGQTWGWDINGVWVDVGCRGLFRVP